MNMSWERDSDREENTDHRFLREGSHERPAKRCNCKIGGINGEHTLDCATISEATRKVVAKASRHAR